MFRLVRKEEGPGPLRPNVQEESRPELGGHQAVEHEVDGTVGEGQHVHELTQWIVARY